MPRWTFALIAVACAASCGRPPAPPEPTAAHQLRDAALAQAKAEGKRVFLWFAAKDADWCDRMDSFLADPKVDSTLANHLVQVKIDIHETEGGLQLYAEMGGDRGVPAFSILDPSGIILADSGSQDQASNIGFPTTEAELDGFDAALKTACPQMTAETLQLLRATLERLRDEHEATRAPSP